MRITSKGFCRLTICFLVLMAASTVRAQDRSGTKITDEPVTTNVTVETMSMLPWKFKDGTKGAQATAKEFLATLMTKAKVDTVSEVKSMAAWEEANGSPWNDDSSKMDLPSPAEMLRTGKKLGVTWVMAGRAQWHTRGIWVSLGPKTKSTCTVDAIIVDVKNEVVALDAKNVQMDDTAKESTLSTLGTVFISGLFTMVSGGPKTPHEQRAVELAMAKALEPWLVQHIKVTKIDTKRK